MQKAKKRRELERALKEKEEELCREIEEKMRKKRRKRKMILSLPESMCTLHPPLRLGSKHFSLSLPKPEEEGYFPVDGKGRYSQLSSKKFDCTEKQLRRMRKRERRERRRRHREEKIRRGETCEAEELESLRSRGDVSDTEVDLQPLDSPPLEIEKPPTPGEKLKKGFRWVLEYVPDKKNEVDSQSKMRTSEKKTTSETSEKSTKTSPSERTSTEQVPKKDPKNDNPTNMNNPKCNYSLECEVCDIEVKTLSALYSHYASHFPSVLDFRCRHLRDNLRCMICGQSYKSKQILTNHIGVKHGKINDILAEQGFKVLPCPVYAVECRARQEMQKKLVQIKKEREHDSQSSNIPNQSFEKKNNNSNGSKQSVPSSKVDLSKDENPKIPNLDHENQVLSPNKPKGGSDKENSQKAPKDIGTTKETRSPKIVLSKNSSDQPRKEKKDEHRYRAESTSGGKIGGQNQIATTSETSRQPGQPALKMKAPVKRVSFSETLQAVEYSEREKRRKKKKRDRREEKREKRKGEAQSSSSNINQVTAKDCKSQPSPENSSQNELKPNGDDLHFCYEVTS